MRNIFAWAVVILTVPIRLAAATVFVLWTAIQIGWSDGRDFRDWMFDKE